MSAALLKLERFDTPLLINGSGAVSEHDVRTQQARAEAFSEGYAAGVAASAAKTGEREKLMAAVTALVEAQAAASPQKVCEQAVAAARVILESVFPALARAGFAVEAASAFSALAKEGAAASFEISTSAEYANALKILLGEMAPGAAIAVKPDPEITGASAKASWTTGGLEFDLDRAGAQCLAAIENAIGKVSSGKMS